jgi:hypothetical protein
MSEAELRELGEDIEHYSQPPFDYPAYQLDALRLAVRHVLANTDDDGAVRWLLSLADCVREYHDLGASVVR